MMKDERPWLQMVKEGWRKDIDELSAREIRASAVLGTVATLAVLGVVSYVSSARHLSRQEMGLVLLCVCALVVCALRLWRGPSFWGDLAHALGALYRERP